MVGRILIVDKVTKKIVKNLYYSYLTNGILENLRNRNDIKIFCDCNEEDKIELKIGKKDNYYIYNARHGNTDKHDTKCPKHANYNSSQIYETGWNEDTDDYGNTVYNIRLEDELLNNENAKKKITIRNRKVEISQRENYKSNSIVKGSITLKGMATKINLVIWKECIERNQYPKFIGEFLKKVQESFRYFRILNNKKSLEQLSYDSDNILSVDLYNKHYFVYMRLVDVQDVKDNFGKIENYILILKDYLNRRHKFQCEKELFDITFNILRFREKTLNTIMVAGFVVRDILSPSVWMVTSLAMFVVNKLGLYCESYNELEVYNRLCEERRLFYKPFRTMPEYGDKIPDIILVDTEKPTIGEIFGIQNDEDYDSEKEEKKLYAKQLSDDYDFWFWDVAIQKEIPSFPK